MDYDCCWDGGKSLQKSVLGHHELKGVSEWILLRGPFLEKLGASLKLAPSYNALKINILCAEVQ